jgi:hypothetical protein
MLARETGAKAERLSCQPCHYPILCFESKLWRNRAPDRLLKTVPHSFIISELCSLMPAQTSRSLSNAIPDQRTEIIDGAHGKLNSLNSHNDMGKLRSESIF